MSYGDDLPDDEALNLVGDVSGGRRVIELGISDAYNSIAVARAGGRGIAVDPDPERIAEMRSRAARAGVAVQCQGGDIADLGFATSGSIDLVLAVGTLGEDDDLGRILRQVHRVLKPGSPFVMSVPHPFSTIGVGTDEPRTYGASNRTIADLLGALARVRFRIETVHELGVDDEHPIPTTLLLKVRKEGN